MARKTTGKLYTSGKKKYYYLRFVKEGREFRLRLSGDNGEPITKKETAEAAAAKIIHPITAKSRVDQLQNIQSALKTAEQQAETADRNLLNTGATLLKGWPLFMTCESRPKSCKRHLIDEIPRHSTPGNYAVYYKQFAAWLKEKYPDAFLLSDVTPGMAGEYMRHVEKEKLSSGSYNKRIQFFKMFYSTLLEDHKIQTSNPFSKITRKEGGSNSRTTLSVEQIAKLIDEASGELRILIALGYFTGLRFGDCCTLLWREVDLVRGIIEREPRKTQHTRKDEKEAIVKVGIPPLLYRLLSETPETSRQGYVLPRFGADYDRGADADLSDIVMKHFEKCGIQTHKEGTGIKWVVDEKSGQRKKTGTRAIVEIGFHSLRYSYISHNAEAGTPAAIIQRNAGHANPAMTEHYTRISDKAAIEYAAALKLPMPAGNQEIIDAEVLESVLPDPERETFRQLADTLPIEQIREIIKSLEIGK